ncbi:MAG: hypothetical protein KC933_01490 [Myxococcales bacterium]|nr:hypothetical protein [Myxococcales bacterium]MCB9651874.1 hypothetical protein [Deltaproteobacteria bacterium]
MTLQIKTQAHEGMSDDVLDLLLDEADRALLDVEARTDEPGRRYALHDPEGADLEELRLAIAELCDAYPGMQYELEAIGDRLRNVGAIAATTELEQRPHIIHLVRMSLEAFFRQYPTVEAYEAYAADTEDEPEEEMQSPAESYDTLRQLLDVLRQRVN